MAGVIPFGTAVLAAVIALSGSTAHAAESSKREAAKADAPYSVFIPIDEHAHPVGSKIYVPELFYQRLYRGSPRPWKSPKAG